MPCTICEGARERGWLCKDHPGQPLEHAGCGGAGVLCVCNPAGAVPMKTVHAEVPMKPDDPRH